jgi:hypothetical protein
VVLGAEETARRDRLKTRLNPPAEPAGMRGVASRRIPGPPRWAFALVAAAAFAVLLTVAVRIWSPQYGLTRFLMAGREFDERGTATYRATPKYLDPYPSHRWGFDGQFYAELALDPLLRDPALGRALDDPPYRARRILLPWLSWLVGLGQPFWILNAYSAMNLVFWLGFAWLTARLFRPHGWAGLAGYAAILLTCGIIECVHASLTDFPSYVLNLAAIVVGGMAGAGLLALAGLARPESLMGFVGLAELGPPWREHLKRNVAWGVIAAGPIALWIGYVVWRFWGRELSFAGGNLDWPLRAIMEKLGEFSVTAVTGSIRWHRWWFELYKSYDLHALLTIISVLTQVVYLALHRAWHDRLWRWGAVVAVYFLCIGSLSWDGHFTVTRHALPMTLVFNLLLAARPSRGWLAWFVLGNCFVPFGVHYFLQLPDRRGPPPPPEFAIVSSATGATPLRAQYGTGWSPQQWEPDATWRWAAGGTATLVLYNETARPTTAELRFITRSRKPRLLEITLGDRVLLQTRVPAAREIVDLALPPLPPGESELALRVTEPATSADDDTPGLVTFLVENPILRIGGAP